MPPQTPTRTTLAVRCRQLRTDSGLSQAALAERAGLDRHTVQHVESAKNVTVDTLDRLADGLGVCVSELVQEISD